MAPQDLLTDLRAQNSLVQCATNYAAMNSAADVVLAAGASPAVAHAPEEIADFTPVCGARSINTRTLFAPWPSSIMASKKRAGSKIIPWVFDPDAHFISGYRRKMAHERPELHPTILRGTSRNDLPSPAKRGPTAATVWIPP